MIFSVFVVCPKNSVCGGNPSTDESAAKKYAEFPTACCVFKSDFDVRMIKSKCKDFFRVGNCRSVLYHVEKRFTYPTKTEAWDKLRYESRGTGHYVKSRFGWAQLVL